MSEVTAILQALVPDEAATTDRLLSLVYDELRQLAACKLAHETLGQTLTATALVHETYLRLVGPDVEVAWVNRRHFFAAAGEAMRRILINRARDKKRLKRGGGAKRICLDRIELALDTPNEELVALDEAISSLATRQPDCAALVKLRFFGGLTMLEAANCLQISLRQAHRDWAYARAWLADFLRPDG